MRRDLSAPTVPAILPPGVMLVPFDRGRAHDCRELMRANYPEGLGDGGISSDEFWAWLTSDSEYDGQLMFVAVANGTAVGFCHCWTSAFVKDLVVADGFRRRGLGRALITLALDAFARRGATAVDLKTETGNIAAQALYRKLGFEVVEQVDG